MPPRYTGRGDPPLPDVDQFDAAGCASPFGAEMSECLHASWLQIKHTIA